MWGVLLALLPVLLHLLRPRPRDRGPLPTARFLSRSTPARVRLSPPDALDLLALRCGALLLLALGLAGPVMEVGRNGTTRLIVLDGGQGMASIWGEALSTLKAASEEGTGGSMWIAGQGAPPQRLLPGPDGIGFAPDLTRPPEPGDPESRYATLLQAAARAAVELPDVDSVELVLVTRPRWSAWAGHEGEIRERFWPGGVDVLAVGEAGGGGAGASSWTAPWEVPEDSGYFRFLPGLGEVPSWEGALTAGLEGDGRRVSEEGGPPGLVLSLHGWGGAVGPETVWTGVLAGDTLIVAGPVGDSLRDSRLPWEWGAPPPPADAEASPPGARDAPSEAWLLLEPWGEPLPLPGGWVEGLPAQDARILGVGGSGRPLSAAVQLGQGCVVYLALPLVREGVSPGPSVLRALRTLARGCNPLPEVVVPLDAGALSLLSGTPTVTPTTWGHLAAAVGGSLFWTRLLLGLALLAIVAERTLAWRRQVSPLHRQFGGSGGSRQPEREDTGG